MSCDIAQYPHSIDVLLDARNLQPKPPVLYLMLFGDTVFGETVRPKLASELAGVVGEFGAVAAVIPKYLFCRVVFVWRWEHPPQTRAATFPPL